MACALVLFRCVNKIVHGHQVLELVVRDDHWAKHILILPKEKVELLRLGVTTSISDISVVAIIVLR